MVVLIFSDAAGRASTLVANVDLAADQPRGVEVPSELDRASTLPPSQPALRPRRLLDRPVQPRADVFPSGLFARRWSRAGETNVRTSARRHSRCIGHSSGGGIVLGRRRRSHELVETAPPLIEELAGDETLRRSALSAVGAALGARNRLLASLGLAGVGWRIANDRVLQAQLREVAVSAREFVTRAERLQARRRRRRRLLIGGGLAAVGGAAGATALFARKQGVIEQSIELDVPVTTAYNQWTQFEEFPEFMQGVEQVRQLDPGHLHWVAAFGGRRHEWDAEISEQRADERIAWHATSGKTNSGVATFHRLSDSRSKIMVQMEFEPEGLRERLGSLFGADTRRVAGDLQRFKQLVESRGYESGAWRGEIHHGDVART
jgi:uncharacterized membrane protein